MSAALRFLGHFADERQRAIACPPAQPADCVFLAINGLADERQRAIACPPAQPTDCVFLAINGLADERQRTIACPPAQPADYAPCSSTASPIKVSDRLMKIKNWISGWNALK